MENLRYLLAAIAAVTLIMSIVSTVNPSYFAGLNAFADHDDEETDDDDNDNSGSSNNDNEEGEEHEDDDNKGRNNEKEDEDDDNENIEGELVVSLGNNSKATLKIDDGDDGDAELEVEIEDGDLDDGTYDVMFACISNPNVDKEFADALDVEEGEGEFEEDLPFTNGTYTGCEVQVGGLSATFASFTIMATVDDDEHDDEDDEEHNEHQGKGHSGHDDKHENELKKESKLKASEDGVEIEVEVEGIEMADGLYDAIFACETPSAFNVTLDNAFEVEDGEGELEETIGLAHGTFSGCDITVQGTELASFRMFTVSEESEDEQEQRVEEKRKEKKVKIVATINGTTIHERHRSQNATILGEFESGWNYTLIANGTAMHDDVHNGTANHEAEINIDMAVWKSNRAIILLDIVGGTVEVENQTYNVVLGYALYTVQHDTFRLGALAVDGEGNVFKLRMSGNAIEGDNDAEFPTGSDSSIDLTFEGSRGPPDRFGDWELTMDGTIEAN